jgi:hypothetical protein
MRTLTCALISYLSLGAVGCSDDEVDSDEEARRAYLGIDGSIAKSIQLGFDGFNAATNANIPPQTTTGTTSGTLTVSGQVDSGASDNKGMRLYISMVDYSDGPIMINEDGDTIQLTYGTAADTTSQPYLNMQLRNFPNGTLDGYLNSGTSMLGLYHLNGAIEGDLELNLTFTGQTMDAGNGDVLRIPGTTHVIGTATSSDGVYDVDLTI